MPDFSNHHHQIGDNLKFLFKELGLEEVFERLDALDGKGGPPSDPEFNPTGDPMVQPNYEGVGSLSGGPNSENSEETALTRLQAETEATKKTTSRSSSSTKK
jgi:hypothetical protein